MAQVTPLIMLISALPPVLELALMPISTVLTAIPCASVMPFSMVAAHFATLSPSLSEVI